MRRHVPAALLLLSLTAILLTQVLAAPGPGYGPLRGDLPDTDYLVSIKPEEFEEYAADIINKTFNSTYKALERLRDVCTGTNAGMTYVDDTPKRKIQALRNRYQDCQYVDGNLEITGLDDEEFYNTDLSFLNSIQEVTGYVLIANVYAQNVTLENLTIIRGDRLFSPPDKSSDNSSNSEVSRGYALFVSLNYRHESDSIGMRLLGLRNLREISNGDVFLVNNNLLCYATTDIYWNYILADSNRQRALVVHHTNDTLQQCTLGCDPTCEVTVPPGNHDDPIRGGVTKRYCWSPGPNNCQKINKVTCAEQCEGRRCFGSQPNQCCHSQCAGGCHGPSKSDCWGCKNFNNDGGCEPYCPQQMIYDNTNFKWILNPERKFALGKLCVQDCPRDFLKHRGGCVKYCPLGFEPKGSTCETCSGPCPKRCQISWEKTMDFLNSQNIDELDGCTSIDGHLKILDASIKGDAYSGIDPMDISQLEKLKSITEITEYLMIQNLNEVGIYNFSFLSNLESILGRKSDTYGTALNIISNKDLEFLGFTSLKRISVGHVIIESNDNLCYLEGLRWGKLYKGTANQKHFVTNNADNDEYCIPNNATCNKECRNGCWGPTAKRCYNCQHYQHGDECLANCTRPMLFSKPENSKRCFDCFAECNSSCSGPKADQCDECRNYRDGPFCVSSCPNDDVKKIHKFPDAKGICQPCHTNCIGGCSGPENTVGLNGCDSCEVSIANSNETAIAKCLPETESCPKGYFTSRNPPAVLAHLKGEKVCIKCHPLCEECEARGTSYCNKCKHYRYIDRCVESCPYGEYYADNGTKICEPCHDTCRSGCTGSTNWECNHCVSFKVYNDTALDHKIFYSLNTSLKLRNNTLTYNTTVESPLGKSSLNSTTNDSIVTVPAEKVEISVLPVFYCTLIGEECPHHKPATSFEGKDIVCVVAEASPNSVPTESISAGINCHGGFENTMGVMLLLCYIVTLM